MTLKTYFIHAHDMWMFRDSRPFNAQQNFVARSTFPPNPQVVYGFLRGHLLEESDTSIPTFKSGAVPSDLQAVIGTPTTHGSLHVHSIHPARQLNDTVERLYPIPADVLMCKDPKDDSIFTIQSPMESADFITNVPFDGWHPLGIKNPDVQYEGVTGWLDESNMQKYLSGQAIEYVVKSDALYKKDERVGLALTQKTKTAREGFLYHAEFVRPHAKTPYYNEEETKNPREAYLHEAHDPDAISGLWVTISADDNRMSEQGIIATGGESRFAYYEKIDTADNITARQEHRGRVKLILQTPAYFSDGWQPKGGWGQLMGEAKLISFAINGYESISGWNIATRKPRPMRRLVPAGSVLYFEDVTNLPDALTENDGDDYPFAQMGFGSYIAAPFDYQD